MTIFVNNQPEPLSMLRVAAAQIESIAFDVDSNLRKHLDAIASARAGGVDVLVFPELSLCGHSGGREASRLAIDRAHPHVETLARASGPMLTLFGAVERAEGCYYNSLFGVRNGSVVDVHRKVNLATYGKLDDARHFMNGRQITAFDLDASWRVAPMICADTWNPPLVHLAAAHGATLMPVAVSSALEAVGGDFDNPSGWDINLRFHALTYGLPIVMANRVGGEDGLTFWGGSRIIDPYGGVQAFADDGEELLEGTLAVADVERARQLLPTIRDANHSLLAAEFARIGDTPSAASGKSNG